MRPPVPSSASLIALLVLQLANTAQLFLSSWASTFTPTPPTLDIAEDLEILLQTTSSTSAPPSALDLFCPGHLTSCLDSLALCTRRTEVNFDYRLLLAIGVLVFVLTVLLFFLYSLRKPAPPVRRWGQVASSPSPTASLSPVSELGDSSFVSTLSSRRAARGL
jgi:hypothetical protein